MKRRRRKNLEKEIKKHPVIYSLIILITLGVSVADKYNLILPENDFIFSLVFFIFTSCINIGIFRLMGLHHAYKQTKKIQYWKSGQKVKLTLYLFFSIMMFAPDNFVGGLIYLVFFFGLLFVMLRAIWNKMIGVKRVLLSSNRSTRSKVNYVAMEEIDRMDGIEFEVFLSKLYDALGYFSEVTPPSGDL